MAAYQALPFVCKVLDINTLMILAVCGAIAIGDYSEGAAVVVLFSFAGYLEDRCSQRARDAIASVLALKPEKAQLAVNGEAPTTNVAADQSIG